MSPIGLPYGDPRRPVSAVPGPFSVCCFVTRDASRTPYGSTPRRTDIAHVSRRAPPLASAQVYRAQGRDRQVRTWDSRTRRALEAHLDSRGNSLPGPQTYAEASTP